MICRLYYQYMPERISACPLTIHALLHIADGIEKCGPVWTYWAFPMERYCSVLQQAVLNSRRHPFQTLHRFVAEDAQLTQIRLIHNAQDDLSLICPSQSNTGVFSDINCMCTSTHFSYWADSSTQTQLVFFFHLILSQIRSQFLHEIGF